MKLRLPIIFSVVCAFLSVFSLPVFANLKSVPVPRLPVAQNDFDTDLFTGSASYTYPIPVPKGTNDLTPDAYLTYNSSAARSGSQRAGTGWQVGHDFIERDVNFTPDQSNTADDKFKLHFKGQVHDLIHVASESATLASRSAYHTKIESHLRINHFGTGGTGSKSAYWEVTETNGTKYRFGYQNQSELVCADSNRNYVTQWDLDQVTDTHDNKIYFNYTDSDGVSYPTSIKYNNDQSREINFIYTDNASKRWMYDQGCKTREASKLYKIQVKANSNVVREFYLGYSTAINGAQLLGSVTEKGSTASASLPPTRFSYYNEVKGWPTQSEPWANSTSIDAHLAQANVTLADVNGDALLDIVKTASGGGNNTWYVLLNQGNSWFTNYLSWANYTTDIALSNSSTRLVDVTGDSKPDIVKMTESGGNLTYTVYQNTGAGWPASGINWVTSNTLNSANITNNNTAFLDVNGDGLPEIVKSQTGDSTKWKIFINTGQNWNTTAEDWTIPTGLDLTMTDLRVVDVNGDGLQDIVRTSVSGSNTTWNVYRNTGKGWETSADPWINGVNIGNADLTRTNVTLADVNGDGLPDIVRSVDSGSADKWEVLLNYGNSWTTSWQTWIDSSQTLNVDSQNSNVQVADVNGDGLADIVRGASGGTWEVWSNKGISTNLLSRITTSLGGSTSFEYASSSAAFDNTGSDALSDLPFGLQPVKKMTVNNGMVGALATNDVTTYSYQDGLYDWEDREFRGFAVVDTVEPNTARKRYVFHQSDPLQGLLAEVQTRNASNDPFHEMENTWSSASSSGIFTVTLDEEKEYTFDGTASNPKVRGTEYLYDNYGNVTKTSELGEIVLNGDERFIHNEYTASVSAWIVNTPSKTYVKAADGITTVSETFFLYDDSLDVDEPPVKGDLTKEIKWLDGGSNPETQYEYDSYGNVTRMIDPNGNDTEYTFNINDSTYTYPEKITNAKDQETEMTYDFGTGNILSKTDANGNSIEYEYDAFGRVTKEIKPYDDNEYPTVEYDYNFDGMAPESILVRVREEGGTSNTVDAFTYIDGLNRKVQTRADAEDPAKQIVTDTYYDPTGNIKKETVPYLASSSALLTSMAGTKFGDGSAGNITISSNTTEAPIDSSVNATAGSNLAAVGSGLGFAADQIVLFYQVQGPDAGLWEFARVKSYSGTALELTSLLTNSYTSSGNKKAQVRVVPQYNNVTVNSGVTWTAKAWDGTTGGILAFLASGTVTVDGTISALGTGFRGGNGFFSPFQDQGELDVFSGEGIASSSTENAGPNMNGGGAGYNHDHGDFDASGGGGGGNGSTGANGLNRGSGGTNPNVGIGGGTAGSTDLTTMVFGGGGGGGGARPNSGHNGGAGGAGGGIVFMVGQDITVSGAVSANGNNGGASGNAAAGGGAGAGGAIMVKGTAIDGTNNITAAGGSAGVGGTFGGHGGAGGTGRVRVEYESSLTGSINPTASIDQTQLSLLPAGYTEYTEVDPAAKHTEWTYDPLGRVSVIENPKSDSRTIAYDHWKETTVDENGHIKRKFFNAFGKISKVEEVLGVTTHETTYEYNEFDQLTEIVDSQDNTSTFMYDTLGRKIAQTDPDMGTWAYAYDAAGNLIGSTDGRNVTVGRDYDELNRLIGVDYPNDTDLEFSYDLGKIGTLSIATDSAGTVFYTYDNRLRKIEETRTINGTTKTTEFEYDSADRLALQTNPDSTESEYTFNEQGEIETLEGIVDNIDYNALGKITKKEFANGLDTDYTYNTNDFRLNRIQTGALQDLNYTYDQVGNITSIVDDVAETTKLFGYDDLDRLTSATGSASFKYAYDYDPIGNLTKFTSADTQVDYTYGDGAAGPHALATSMKRKLEEVELLDGPWNLAESSGSDEEDMELANPYILSGRDAVKVTFDLHGTEFGTGDDEASIVFVQGGEWMAANVIPYADNGLDGEQTVEIPLSDFVKVNDTEVLDTEAEVTNLHTRFWNDDPFTVDVTSIKVVIHPPQQRTNGMLEEPWTLEGEDGSDEEDIAIPADSLKDKNTVRITFDLNGTTFGGGDDEASIVLVQGDWYGINVTDYGVNGRNGEQTIDVPLEDFRKVNDTEMLDLNGEVSNLHTRFWNSGAFSVDVKKVELLNLEEIGHTGDGYRWSQNDNAESNDNKVAASGINDGNVGSDVDLNNGSDDDENAWEAAGVVWDHESGSVTKVEYINGTWDGNNNGAFTQNFHLQFTYDGHTWVDSGWGVLPDYDHDNSDSSGKTYTFIGEKASAVKGVRVTGQVRTDGANSWHAFARELKIYTNTEETGSAIVYDENGNMVQEGNKCYEYNDGNELARVAQCNNNQTIAEYIYDYAGIRLIKKNYDGGSLDNVVIAWTKSFETKETIGVGIETTNYFFANRELVAMKKPDNSMRYFHNDHLGSSTVITDQSGDLVEETTFGPWGEVMDGGTESKYQFTGHEKDDETGLNYMNARYYSADLKRFTQPDELIQNVYDPQMLNRYAYARNNPLKYVDPSGNAIEFRNGRIQSTYSVLNPPQPKPAQTTQQYVNKLLNPVNLPPAPGPRSQQPSQPAPNNSSSDCRCSRVSDNGNNSQNIAQKETFQLDEATIKRNGQIGTAISGLPMGARLTVFGAMVMTFGPMDYKNRFVYGPNARALNEDRSNFNYGYVGTKAGIPADLLLRGAGLEQMGTNSIVPITEPLLGIGAVQTESHPLGPPPYGDDAHDQRYIRAGIEGNWGVFGSW